MDPVQYPKPSDMPVSNSLKNVGRSSSKESFEGKTSTRAGRERPNKAKAVNGEEHGGSFDSNDITPNGMTTPSQGSVSSYSSTDDRDGSPGGKVRSRTKTPKMSEAAAPSAAKTRLTKEEREMFLRIEREWREEDEWAKQEPGIVSTMIWTPILIGLRCFNIWLSVVTWPMSFAAKLVFGIEMKKASFWDVPLERRKQTIAVLGFVMLLPCVVISYAWSVILLIFPLTTFPMLMYYLYIFYWDKSPENGKRRPFIRYWKLWRHFSNYFPLRLIKTANLDPNRKYVFAYHPHGIISIGAFGNFATNATGFSRKFPGIDLRLLTLEMNFWCPWVREFLLHMGLCSASRASCNNILSKGPGSAIMLVVGGAAESLDTEPGTYRLTLGRKGFVRVALDNEADLVPVLAFGENDVFDVVHYQHGTWARSVQEQVRKTLGFATPVFFGRGIFNYSLGVLPHRRPIICVVGNPIKLPKLPPHLKGHALSTTAEGIAIVDKYHELYVKELRNIWTQYRDRWAVHRVGSLLVNK